MAVEITIRTERARTIVQAQVVEEATVMHTLAVAVDTEEVCLADREGWVDFLAGQE